VLSSTATGYEESFSVEQHYWWDGDQLRGVAVSERKDGIETAKSVTYVEGNKYVSRAKRGDKEEVYYGVVRGKGILWLPSNMNRAEDYQIQEFFLEKDDGLKLMTEGFDTFIHGEGMARIIIRGELVRQADEKE